MIRMTVCLIFLLLVCQHGVAQELRLISLCEINDEMSIPQRFDLNDNPCAAIQVFAKDVSDTLNFKGSIWGDIVHQDSLYLIYVPNRTKKVTIYNANYLPLEIDFTYYTENHLGLKGGAVYKMQVMPDIVKTNDTSISLQQGMKLLVFTSETPLAKLMVNGKQWKISNDSARRLLPYGTYDYEAIAVDGRNCHGRVELKPSFGNKNVAIKF